jgi:serine/threonine protein kinase
VRLLGKGGFG